MKSSDFITESKGQAAAALRKVISDLGLVTRSSVYSDKRRTGRRVKANVYKLNPRKTKSYPDYNTFSDPDPMPTQEQVEALVAKHFVGMDVLKVTVHERHKDAYNDHSYIAVSVREESVTESVIAEAGEKRIPTGVGKTTVPDPSTISVKAVDKYSGDPMGKHIGDVQERNFDALSAILKRNKRKFKYLGWVAYEGSLDYTRRYDAANKGKKANLTRFVMTGPGIVWEKYEGSTAGGGRNTVYVGGRKMKLTQFLKLKPADQDKLITLDPSKAEADAVGEIKAKMKRVSNNKLLQSAYWGGRSDYDFIERLVQKPRAEWTDAQWRRIGRIAIQS